MTNVTKPEPAATAKYMSDEVNLLEDDEVCRTAIKHISPIVREIVPIGSSRMIFSQIERLKSLDFDGSAGKTARIMTKQLEMMGMLIQNAQRHPKLSEITPPRIGPETVHIPVQPCQ